jgi:ABC-2 type transport system permease protein
MRTDQIVTIARREYLTRVQSKGFWIATLLLPAAMAVLVVVPSLILMGAKSSHRLIVVDEVGGVGERLAAELARDERREREEQRVEAAIDAATEDRSLEAQLEADDESITSFTAEIVAAEGDREAQRAELDRRVLEEETDAWIWISPASLESSEVEYHARSVSNFLTRSRLERALSRVFAEVRLTGAGYEAEKVVELTRAVDLETLKVTEEGSRAESGEAGFFLAYALFFLLYMVVAIYGQLVMNGVLEEKTSRIVEVLLATTTPRELLYGKLVGIGGAGLTQLAVWMVALGALTAPGVLGAMATGLADVVPTVSPAVLVHFLAHFLLGFFLFSAMYAAIGSAVNTTQEAQPLTGIILPFLIAPVLFMPAVINDPDSSLAVGLSLVPPFTPLLMLLRIVVKMPPAWQIALGYVLTTLFVAGLMALCARVYRIGILMHGKRPTFAELGRWIRRA